MDLGFPSISDRTATFPCSRLQRTCTGPLGSVQHWGEKKTPEEEAHIVLGAQILQHFAPRHRALAPPEGPLSLLHEAFPVTDSSTYTNIFHALLLSLKVPASRAKKPTDWILYKHFLGLRALNESSLPLERVPSACREHWQKEKKF